MPFYNRVKTYRPEVRQRLADRLLALRKQIRNEVPLRTANDTLLLATWNIRDFDSNKFGHGPRLTESFHYIAEVISAFDLVAIQEVNDDLAALRRVMRILGGAWDFIVTDVTEGVSGNRERMAFVYDTRKVSFRNIAGEIVLPKTQKSLILKELQFARTPFLVAFQSGWFKFQLCTVHIYYGSSSDSSTGMKRRIAEIGRVVSFLAGRNRKAGTNFILLGDFNIVSPEHETMKALKKHKFFVPDSSDDLPSNMKQNRHYDQIAFKVREDELEMGDGGMGVLNFYKSVFRPRDYDAYAGVMDPEKRDLDDNDAPRDEAGKKRYYEGTWRTFQMSDHLPMWVELRIDFSERYLEGLKGQ